MRARVGCWALGERLQEQRLIFLRSEPRHAHKKHVAVLESLLRTPFLPGSLGVRIKVRGNTIGNHAAAVNSIEALDAGRHFLRNRNRLYSVSKRISLNQARPRFNLACLTMVDGVGQ